MAGFGVVGDLKHNGYIRIYSINLCAEGVNLEPFAQDWLDGIERGRARRFLQKRDREQYVGSHLALRSVLARQLRVHPSVIVFESRPDGKPMIKNTCGRLDFSLSHSGGWALIAMSRAREVGVDVEIIKRRASLKAVAQRFFSQAEAERAGSAIDAGDGGDMFYRLWVLKEAVLKAWGSGLKQLGDVEINAKMTDLTPQSAKNHPSKCHLRLIELGEEKRAAVAWLGAPATVQIIHTSLVDCLA